MARKQDLEQLLRDSYEIIAENQQIIQESFDLPAPKKRAKRQVDQQWGLIRQYLAEYIPLCLAIQAEIPEDIIQILARFPDFISKITEIVNGEQVFETAASELLNQVKLAEANLSAFGDSAEQKDYGREITELRGLIEKYRSEITNLRFLRHDRSAQIIDIRSYLERTIKEFDEWEKKYTSLRLTHELKLTAWYGEVAQLKRQDRPKELSIREAVEAYERLIILGEPGSGKTTSLKRMALDYAQKSIDNPKQSDCSIPVFMQLGNYTDRVSLGLAQHPYENILWLIGNALQSVLKDHKVEITVDDVKLTLESHQFIFFFDGLNEIAENLRLKCADAIREFANFYEKHHYVITSRKYGYIPRLNYETLEILELSLDDISQYVGRYLNLERAHKLANQLSPQLRRIAQNPLVLRIMINVFEEKEQLPRSRGKLLQRYVELALERDVEERGLSLNYPKIDDIQLKLSVCVPLGYWMQTGGQYISESMALKLIEQELENLNRHDILASKIIDDLCNSRLIERTGQSNLRFWHQTIQEYFAAVRVSNEWRIANDEDKPAKTLSRKHIDNYINNLVWHETFAMAAGLLDSRELHLLVRYLRRRNVLLMSMCIGNSENLSDSDEQSIIRELYNSLRIWKYLSPEPLRVLINSWAFLVLAFGYWLIKGHPLFQFLWSHGLNGFEVFFSIIEVNLFNFIIPNSSIVYAALVWYWSWPSQVLIITNTLFPTILLTIGVYLIWKGLSKLNELVFARRIYNSLTALRQIGTINARDALAQLNIETQSNIWVHPQYKVAILAAQLVSADSEAELLELLLNQESRLYAIDVLGEIATDNAVNHLHTMVNDSDELIARGAIDALTKVAQKRDYQKEKVVGNLEAVLVDKTRFYATRLEAYNSLKKLQVKHINRPWPNWKDITRTWNKIRIPAIAILTTILIFLVLNTMVWVPNNSTFFYDDLNAEGLRWGSASKDEDSSFSYKNGGCEITLLGNAYEWVARRLEPYIYKDFIFEVDAKSVAGNGSYGVFFRSPDRENRYVFVINSDGNYHIYTITSFDASWYPEELTIDEGYSATISQDINHITVSVLGNIARFSVNGTELSQTTITDPIFSKGNIGLMAVHSPTETSNFTAHFDNTRISDPHTVAVSPNWLEPMRQPIGFGLASFMIILAAGLMYGQQTLVRIVKIPWSNPSLLLAIVLSLPAYIFILGPMIDSRIPNNIKATSFSVWWISLVISIFILGRNRNLILNIVFGITAIIVVLPIVPIIIIYLILKNILDKLIKPKHKSQRGRGISSYILSFRLQLFEQLGRYDWAISELEQTVAELRPLQPDPATKDLFSNAAYELGWRYYLMGNLQKGENIAQDGIKLELKPLQNFYNLLGVVKSNMGAHDDALRAFSKAIEIFPSDAYLYRNRGSEWVALGNLAKAREDYEIAQKMEPTHSSILFRFAIILEMEENYEGAIDYYRKSIKIDSYRADTRFSLGLCLLRAEKPEEAQKEYEKGLKRLSGYGAKKDLREASDELRESISSLPSPQDAEKILIKLEQKLKKL